MKKLNVSAQNAKVIYIVLTLLVLVGAFMMYKSNMNEKKELDVKVTMVDKQLSELRVMESQKAQKEAETLAFNDLATKHLNMFPSKITSQKAIYILNQMSDTAGVVLLSIDPVLNEKIDLSMTTVTPAPVIAATDKDTDTEEKEVPQIVEHIDEEVEFVEDGQVHYDKLAAFASIMTVSFVASYDQLAKVMDYINASEERLSIGDSTISFDNATGNLSVVMDIKMFALQGNGKPYVDPDISNVKLGVSNIFGTFAKTE